MIYQKIQDLSQVAGISKHERIVQGIIHAIDEQIITEGEVLPSVNMMVAELGFARKTITKAYAELKERGIIESKNRMGYYVTGADTEQVIKVMLLLYAFHSVQKTFFSTFQLAIGENAQIDTFFHHNNPKVFRSLLTDNLGKYGMFIIAPIQAPEARDLLYLIPPKKLLLIDRHIEVKDHYSFITQKFADALFLELSKVVDDIRQYEQMVLFYRGDTDFPSGTLKGFLKFVKQYKIKYQVERLYLQNSLQSGTLYYTINDSDLWTLLRDCHDQQIELGKDIGILSQDETPLKEFLNGGISTFSTDFRFLAYRAAEFVHERKKVREILPSKITRRTSF
ncbi:MAG: GntR family transcriptional regulator [Saprospiraceae bacterium]